jgi:hypothetical protein
MPQPLSKVCPKATVSLHLEHSTNKPELAVLVSGVFARWAWIEHSISVLLLHILGAEAKPALAMFSVLNGQRLQMSAVRAAAKAALPPDQFEIFAAVMSVIECVQKDRNRLAHWIWGSCPELPDSLLLANPESLKTREIRMEEHTSRVKAHTSKIKEHAAKIKETFGVGQMREFSKALFKAGDQMAWFGQRDNFEEIVTLDPSNIFVYSKQDLERSKRDLGETMGSTVHGAGK